MTLRQKIVNRLLAHERLVAVPEEWQREYVKLAGDKIRNSQAIQDLIREYNSLLKDYYEKHTIKELEEILKAADIKGITQLNKSELVNLAVNEYRMFWKKD